MQTLTSHKKILSMVLIGSILETYDYSLYGYFAAILAKLFFPTLNPLSALLAAFTVFAVGFMTRPLGAAIFGNYGDKYGRKKMLMLSIILMALPTTLIGLIPTYAQIGIYAGVLLTLCRLLQGIAVGAEFAGTMVYMIEQAPAHRKTLYGSLCICSGYIAMLMSAIIVMLLTHFLSADILQTWGWRIPFLFGMVLGLLGLYIRSTLSETPEFNTLLAQKATAKYPLLETVSRMPLTLLMGTGAVMLHVLGFYLLFVYMTSYLIGYYKISPEMVSSVNTLVLIFGIVSLPIIGLCAEKINKKYVITASAIGLICFSYPLLKLLSHGTFLSILIAESGLTFLLCLTSAVLPAFLAELFPTALRYTGMALCYNLSAVIFGGTTPLVLTFLLQKTHNLAAPSFYLILAALVTLFSVFMVSVSPNRSSYSSITE